MALLTPAQRLNIMNGFVMVQQQHAADNQARCPVAPWTTSGSSATEEQTLHGAQTDVGNREFLHKYNAVCGKTGVKHHCRTTLNLKSR